MAIYTCNKPVVKNIKSIPPSNTVFTTKFLVYLILISIGVAGTLSFRGWEALPFQILLGMAFAHGVELQHQALHWTGFTSRAWNRRVGFLLGLPMLVSFAAYQASHLRHHKLVGTPGDKEFFDYGDRSRLAFADIVVHLFMLRHYAQFSARAKAVLFGAQAVSGDKHAKDIQLDYQLMLLILAGTAVASFAHGSTVVLSAWLLPLLFVAAPVHALIELPEHYGCDSRSPDVFRNTRTIRSNAFMTWFTNGNNLHVEHHYRLMLPIETLPRLHAEISDRIVYYNRSYTEFYRQFFGDVLKPRFDPWRTDSAEDAEPLVAGPMGFVGAGEKMLESTLEG